jgi:hypothetical protein
MVVHSTSATGITLAICAIVLMRIQFAFFSIIDRSIDLLQALRESWIITNNAPWLFIAEALIIIVLITKPLSTHQIIAVFSGTSIPLPLVAITIRVIKQILLAIAIPLSCLMGLFTTALYRRMLACCGYTTGSCSCK